MGTVFGEQSREVLATMLATKEHEQQKEKKVRGRQNAWHCGEDRMHGIVGKTECMALWGRQNAWHCGERSEGDGTCNRTRLCNIRPIFGIL